MQKRNKNNDKAGKFIDAEHQLCFAHSTLLAVRNVLYKINSNFDLNVAFQMMAKTEKIEEL